MSVTTMLPSSCIVMITFSITSFLISHKHYDSELAKRFSGSCQDHQSKFHDDGDDDGPQHNRQREGQSHSDFVVSDQDKMLLCHSRAVKGCLIRTEPYHSSCSNLFISVTKRKKQVFWIRLVIDEAPGSSSEADSTDVKDKTHEVCKLGTFSSLGRTAQISKF